MRMDEGLDEEQQELMYYVEYAENRLTPTSAEE